MEIIKKEGGSCFFVLLLLLLPGKVGVKDEGWVRVDFPFYSSIWGCGGGNGQWWQKRVVVFLLDEQKNM